MPIKHGFQVGDIALRRNSDNKWVKFIFNETYIALANEYPEDYKTLAFKDDLVVLREIYEDEELNKIFKELQNNSSKI